VSTIHVVFLAVSSTFECVKPTSKIYQDLGVPHSQAFSQDGPHDHSSVRPDQKSEIAAFFDHLLLDEPADSAVFRMVGNWTNNRSWVPWSLPNLTEYAC